MSPALANGDDYVLGVYGNANEDDTIDMRDLTYVKLIFFGKKPETELADAKYDGKINPLDFIQIKLIIVGKEKVLTIVDSADKIKTVKKPIKGIVTYNTNALETMRSIKVEKDRIVGVSIYAVQDAIFFPEFSDYPAISGWPSLDCEKILGLYPEVVILYGTFFESMYEDAEEKLKPAGITVIGLDLCRPTTEVEEVKKLGYIFDKRNEADEFIDFYHGIMDTIKEEVEDIVEDERPRVYFEAYKKYHSSGNVKGGYHDYIEMAGGHSIFSDIHGIEFPDVDAEEVIERDPEIIVKLPWAGGYDVDDVTKLKSIRDEIMDRPELKEVSAVKKGKVYVISSEITGTASHVVSIAYMAKWFHLDLFEDLDPQAIHQEYLTRFQRLDYDLDKHGVFVYHSEEHPNGK
jgi:iron complex transport system substrate-binding protein